MVLYVAIIFGGTAMFGAAVGSWRDPMQALYTAINFPLIVLLTTFGNGMLAPLLGIGPTLNRPAGGRLAVSQPFPVKRALR